LFVIPEEPALSEVEWGICFCICFLGNNPLIVISTEADHSFIVSRAAEKSAFLPRHNAAKLVHE
jgi:hypothetical protein